jgi:hypothetical protein
MMGMGGTDKGPLGTERDPLHVKVTTGTTAKDLNGNPVEIANQVGDTLKDAASQIKDIFSLTPTSASSTGGFLSNLRSLTTLFKANGGFISGPGTGTSDSIWAKVSNGEFVMPADKAKKFGPILDAMRSGALSFADGGWVQSIAIPELVPSRVMGGVNLTEQAAANAPVAGNGGAMMIQLHPDALHMTMRDWLEMEVARQRSRS